MIIEHECKEICAYDENDIGNTPQELIADPTEYLARIIEIQNT